MKEALAYKRLETDDEYRKRCCGSWCAPRTGEALDEHIMWVHGTKKDMKQRRIIEVFP